MVASGLAVGGAVAQPEDAHPEWSDELFEDLGDAAEQYNAQRTPELGTVERWLLRDTQYNLHIRDEDGAEAVYSFALNDELRVEDLRRDAFQSPTFRVATTKSTVERLLDADDVESSVRQAVWRREIQVERVFEPFGGMQLHVGAAEVVFAAGTITILAVDVAKVGLNSIAASVHTVARRGAGEALAVWAYIRGIGLGTIINVLTILDVLGLLDPLRRSITRIRGFLHGVAVSAIRQVRKLSSHRNRDDEDR